jgi:hypothetical protein
MLKISGVCGIQIRFQVFTAASMKVAVFWDDRPDDGGSNHLWNVGKLLPDYTAQHPRRQSIFLPATTWYLIPSPAAMMRKVDPARGYIQIVHAYSRWQCRRTKCQPCNAGVSWTCEASGAGVLNLVQTWGHIDPSGLVSHCVINEVILLICHGNLLTVLLSYGLSRIDSH